MTTDEFVKKYLPLAEKAEKMFHINPTVVLAQAALESDWGNSALAQKAFNFFGLTAYGKSNDYWHGGKTDENALELTFRRYDTEQNSFLDFGRLISSVYPSAAAVSYYTDSYAREIAYSRYISEKNGDNRIVYRVALQKIAKGIQSMIDKLNNKSKKVTK